MVRNINQKLTACLNFVFYMPMDCVFHAGLCADFGSTEICKLLSWVFDQPEIEGYARQVFVLTGGEVYEMVFYKIFRGYSIEPLR